MATSLEATYEKLCENAREVKLLESLEELLCWDEQTMMPAAGADYRADQLAYLAGQGHQRRTDPQVGEYLAELADSPLAADPYSDAGANIRLLNRDYEKQAKLPQDLVEELARAGSQGQHAWRQARTANDFLLFRPKLERLVELKREEAAAVGFTDTPYDPLLDDYEPEAVTSQVQKVLNDLRDALVPLVQQIVECPRQAPREIVERRYPVEAQREFGLQVVKAIGFDLDRGRIDVSAHPFCAMLGPGDVRLTTRYRENNFADSFFAVVHEAGHGIYDQGLPHQHFGLPIGTDVSTGVHESQSGMWENMVALSRPFWEHFYPQAQQSFPEALTEVSLDEFFWAVNALRPSHLRLDADEATYNLHILIRFELEVDLIEDRLQVADLVDAWNERYRHYLNIDVPSDAEGVMQDVHWSEGLFGYFPTYSLGNLYAAQFFAQAKRDIPDLDEQFRRGEFAPLKNWLHERIHQHGRRYSSNELLERVTGSPLSHEALLAHLSDKYGELYRL